MGDDKLKSCPFCGKTPYMRIDKFPFTRDAFRVECDNDNCAYNPVGNWQGFKAQAIDAWNKRRGL